MEGLDLHSQLILDEYRERLPQMEQLKEEVLRMLREAVNRNGLVVTAIEARVKTEERLAGKLALKGGLILRSLREYHNSACVHIKPVAGVEPALFLFEVLLKRFRARKTRRAEHTRRLVHDENGLVFVDYLDFAHVRNPLKRILIDVEPLHHKA